MTTHSCIDCRKDPPKTVRPIATPPGKPARCFTHRVAESRRLRLVRSAARIRREFGIEPEVYWAIYDAQGGTCAIRGCAAIGKVRLLSVDHDHRKARDECGHDPKKGCPNCIRGLLCSGCNSLLIGRFASRLQAGLDYLASPPARQVLDRV
jgi:hypothetical protein